MAGVLGEPPFTLGWDVSGVVEETGFGVTTLKAGDEVYGMPWFPRAAGGYAEYVTAPARQFAPGQRVLIHAAAGGVGHFAVQFAKRLGAHVTGTASLRPSPGGCAPAPSWSNPTARP